MAKNQSRRKGKDRTGGPPAKGRPPETISTRSTEESPSQFKKLVKLLVWLVPLIVAALSCLFAAFSWSTASDARDIARESNELSKQLADRADAEKIEIFFEGGDTCADEYETEFAVMKDAANAEKVIMPTRWPLIMANNGYNTVSIVHHIATSWIHGKIRNVETRFLDEDGIPVSTPPIIASGQSLRLLLEVPVRVPIEVFRLVEGQQAFSEPFKPSQLENFLKDQHNIDLYGNTYKHPVERAGKVGPNEVSAHLFTFDERGTLTEAGHQADQVTLEVRTSRDNYFTATAHYYEMRTFRPPQVMYLPRGKPATIRFKLEELDSLPETPQ